MNLALFVHSFVHSFVRSQRGISEMTKLFSPIFCIKLDSHKVTKVERSNQNLGCNISQTCWDVKLNFFYVVRHPFQVDLGEHAWTCPKLYQIISWLLYMSWAVMLVFLQKKGSIEVTQICNHFKCMWFGISKMIKTISQKWAEFAFFG